jgi:hypothetical protein
MEFPSRTALLGTEGKENGTLVNQVDPKVCLYREISCNTILTPQSSSRVFEDQRQAEADVDDGSSLIIGIHGAGAMGGMPAEQLGQEVCLSHT